MPELIICAGAKDFLYRQSVELVEVMNRIGVPHIAVMLPCLRYSRF